MFFNQALRGIALLLSFVGSPAWSLDPAQTDIVSLRLGMTRLEVTSRLGAQGYKWEEGGIGGSTAILSRTKDGMLRADFASDGRVRRIAYTFNERAPNEEAILLEAVVDHYGPPIINAPLTWCVASRAERTCPPDQPLLTYGPGKDGKDVLTLAAAAKR